MSPTPYPDGHGTRRSGHRLYGVPGPRPGCSGGDRDRRVAGGAGRCQLGRGWTRHHRRRCGGGAAGRSGGDDLPADARGLRHRLPRCGSARGVRRRLGAPQRADLWDLRRGRAGGALGSPPGHRRRQPDAGYGDGVRRPERWPGSRRRRRGERGRRAGASPSRGVGLVLRGGLAGVPASGRADRGGPGLARVGARGQAVADRRRGAHPTVRTGPNPSQGRGPAVGPGLEAGAAALDSGGSARVAVHHLDEARCSRRAGCAADNAADRARRAGTRRSWCRRSVPSWACMSVPARSAWSSRPPSPGNRDGIDQCLVVPSSTERQRVRPQADSGRRHGPPDVLSVGMWQEEIGSTRSSPGWSSSGWRICWPSGVRVVRLGCRRRASELPVNRASELPVNRAIEPPANRPAGPQTQRRPGRATGRSGSTSDLTLPCRAGAGPRSPAPTSPS